MLIARKLVLRQQVVQLGAPACKFLLPLAQGIRPRLGVHVGGLARLPGRRLLCRALGPVRAVPAAKAVCHLLGRTGPRARVAKQAAQCAPVGAILAVKAQSCAVGTVHARQRVLDPFVVAVLIRPRHGRFRLCLLFLLVVQSLKGPHVLPPFQIQIKKNGRICAAMPSTLNSPFRVLLTFCCRCA